MGCRRTTASRHACVAPNADGGLVRDLVLDSPTGTTAIRGYRILVDMDVSDVRSTSSEEDIQQSHGRRLDRVLCCVGDILPALLGRIADSRTGASVSAVPEYYPAELTHVQH